MEEDGMNEQIFLFNDGPDPLFDHLAMLGVNVSVKTETARALDLVVATSNRVQAGELSQEAADALLRARIQTREAWERLLAASINGMLDGALTAAQGKAVSNAYRRWDKRS
jgi:hypothetical protein